MEQISILQNLRCQQLFHAGVFKRGTCAIEDSFFMFILILAGIVIFVALIKYIFSSWQFDRYNREFLELHQRSLEEANEKNLRDFNNNIHEQRQKFEKLLDSIVREKQMGYPSLAEKFAEAKAYAFDREAFYMENKRPPSPKSAERVRACAREMRIEAKKRKIAEYTLEFYEGLYPHLRELRREIEPSPESVAEYDGDEKKDPSSFFLSPDEYRNLPEAEKNQLALDRYFKRKLSNWDIGKRYERFIGYNYEINGYDVTYKGILDNFEDRGIDLICRKADKVVLVQCKYWSISKDIFEKHIFQFYGTCFFYEYNERLNGITDKKYKKVFYTKTTLSDFARYSAKKLGITIREGATMPDIYPCIKCNISRTGEKIYHLPFDQQYDRIKINVSEGECFCNTVKDAENLGFRRAFKHNYRQKNV